MRILAGHAQTQHRVIARRDGHPFEFLAGGVPLDNVVVGRGDHDAAEGAVVLLLVDGPAYRVGPMHALALLRRIGHARGVCAEDARLRVRAAVLVVVDRLDRGLDELGIIVESFAILAQLLGAWVHERQFVQDLFIRRPRENGLAVDVLLLLRFVVLQHW